MEPRDNYERHSDKITTELQIAVGIMQSQMNSIDVVCNKILEKQDRWLEKIYDDMEKQKKENESEITDLHSRIDKVSAEMSGELKATEQRIMSEIKSLRTDFIKHREAENKIISKLIEWKWMIVGGIFTFSWIFTHFDVVKFFIYK